MLVFGGSDGVSVTNSLFDLNLDSLTWTERTFASKAAPAPRIGHMSEIVAAQLIVVGGHNPCLPTAPPAFNDVWILDLGTGMWQQIDTGTSFPGLQHSAMCFVPVFTNAVVKHSTDTASSSSSTLSTSSSSGLVVSTAAGETVHLVVCGGTTNGVDPFTATLVLQLRCVRRATPLTAVLL